MSQAPQWDSDPADDMRAGDAKLDPSDRIVALVDQLVARLHRRQSWVSEEPVPTTFERARLARFAVARDLDGARRLVAQALKEGRTSAWVATRLVAAAAELLGRDWGDDRISFVDVTVAAGLLQRLVRTIAVAPVLSNRKAKDLILLTTTPNEQHTLGLYVIANAVEQDGWAVHLAPRMTSEQVGEFVARECPLAVGLAVSNPRDQALRPMLRAIRTGALPTPHVFAGGPVELTSLGLDHALTVVEDADDALRCLRELTH